MCVESDHVLLVRIVQALELFNLIVHLDLQSRSRRIVTVIQCIDEQCKQRLFIDTVLGKVAADAVDLIPIVRI